MKIMAKQSYSKALTRTHSHTWIGIGKHTGHNHTALKTIRFHSICLLKFEEPLLETITTHKQTKNRVNKKCIVCFVQNSNDITFCEKTVHHNFSYIQYSSSYSQNDCEYMFMI